MYDVIIIGGGPAGMSAAVYAARACLKTLIIEREPISGGQILNTVEVDNYLGLPGVSGYELARKFSEHVKALQVETISGVVTEVHCTEEEKRVVVKGENYQAKALVFAMGATHRRLGIPGEEELKGMGVSYCATCDGMFFRNKTVAVVGGGDVALEDALYLSNVCEKVYLIHRRDSFRGAKALQEKAHQQTNIEILTDTIVTRICGDGIVDKILLKEVKTGEEGELAINGIFIAVGTEPVTDLLKSIVQLDENGYVIAGENCRTNIEGVYAVGDVRQKPLRQIVTAVADGANAISDLEKYLFSIKK